MHHRTGLYGLVCKTLTPETPSGATTYLKMLLTLT